MLGLMLLLLFLMILFVTFFYVLNRDILAPPIVMVAVFGISTVFALANANNWEIEYSIQASMIIISGIISFSIPYIVISHIKSYHGYRSFIIKSRILYISTLKMLVIICIDILIIYLYKKSINELVSASGYIGTNIKWQYRNMSGIAGTNYLSGTMRMVSRFVDASCFICSYVFVNNVIVFRDKMKSNFIYLVPMILYCIKGLEGGGRQDILKIISFIFVTSYILNRQKVGWNIDISIKYILIAIASILLVLPIFYYALSFAGRSTTKTFFQMISIYIGGPIKSFNDYVQNPTERAVYWGEETFVPILNALGSFKFINFHKTIHLEYRQLGSSIGNIYTFFRRPLHDFGLVGMYIFTIIISISFSYFYVFKIKYKSLCSKQDMHIIVYSYMFYWIIMSSIEQYSMIFISFQTILIIVSFYLMWFLCFNVHISRHSIIIRE